MSLSRSKTGFSLLVLVVLITACTAPISQPTVSPPTGTSTNIPPAGNDSIATAAPSASVLPMTQTPSLPAAISAVPGQTALAAFVDTNHNLFAWAPGSSAFWQVADTGDVQEALPSPDGSLVAYTRSADLQTYSLELVRADGTQTHTLLSSKQFQAFPHPEGSSGTSPHQMQWIPGTHLLAMTVRGVLQGPGTMIGRDLIVIDADNGTFHTLLTESDGFSFTFSPDGKYIATSLADGVNLYDSTGKPAAPTKFFGFPSINTASEYQYLPEIHWSSDGSSFAFFVPPAEPFSTSPGDTRLIRVEVKDLAVTTPLSAKMEYLFPLEITPDLATAAYTTLSTSSSQMVVLHLANLKGNTIEIYPSGQKLNRFFWSPDNVHFLFSSNEGITTLAYLGQPGIDPAPISIVTSMRDAAWLDASHYLIVDKTAMGWKIWYGHIGAEPAVVYSDSNAKDDNTTLSIHR